MKLYPELQASDENIIEKFDSLENFKDVADLLEIPEKFLWGILVVSKEKNYNSFTIKKKNGNDRLIYSPVDNLSILQKKFSYILSKKYTNHMNAHGFIRNRSIVSNATVHLKQRFILNFDLEDYFTSINFGRVRAMFMSYFRFNEKVSSTLANICCHHEGFLPQGAATSPIIANIISYNLDKELTKLAKKYHCKYTRYADDITFSTKKNEFPIPIATKENNKTILSSLCRKIVRDNGFSINDEKTRLSSNKERMSVTGITVNEKLNIDRRYIRRIRSILHCIEKNKDDIEIAEKIFYEKYKFRIKKDLTLPKMFDVVRGMISYVGQVKSKNDPVFLKLARRYNLLVETVDYPFINLPIDYRRLQQEYTYVIESLGYEYTVDGETDDKCVAYTGQGTGFILKGIGLVTNWHVLEEYIEHYELDGLKYKDDYIKIHRSKYFTGYHYAKLLKYDESKDIALLEVRDLDINNVGFDYNEKFEYEQDIQVIGYPEYKENMDISVTNGKRKGERSTNIMNGKRELRYEVSADIWGGNSGGPVVNMENEVVGVAAKGAGKVPPEVIPIEQVIELACKLVNDNNVLPQTEIRK